MVTMRILTTILFICAVSLTVLQIGCKETDPLPLDPLDASRIEGSWTELTGSLNPEWHYVFDRGLLTQSYEGFGATLTTLTYPYATRQDSVFIGGDTTNAPRVWVLEFECEEVVKVRHVGVVIGATFWLKRE